MTPVISMVKTSCVREIVQFFNTTAPRMCRETPIILSHAPLWGTNEIHSMPLYNLGPLRRFFKYLDHLCHEYVCLAMDLPPTCKHPPLVPNVHGNAALSRKNLFTEDKWMNGLRWGGGDIYFKILSEDCINANDEWVAFSFLLLTQDKIDSLSQTNRVTVVIIIDFPKINVEYSNLLDCSVRTFFTMVQLSKCNTFNKLNVHYEAST